ncbi:nrf-6 [Symbiodinium pilosum]|uniref:Nrf-6 protein n=1 Tax=Symbiodinium pilosum TaxID=2952 RepID=A0A812Y4P4_SYMPI|nr:nrf-6 [Symbiodinium pilosum]
MSTGKSLPRDAGKFLMCSGLPGAHYMLVEMLGALPTRVVHSVQMAVGLCLPKACEPTDVPMLMNTSLVQRLVPDLSVLRVSDIHASDPVGGLASPGIGFALAVSVVVALVGLIASSTWMVGFTSQAREETPEAGRRASCIYRCFEAFSLVGRTGTLSKLVELPPSKPTDCLNGLRVLAMCWIILGHTFLMPEGVSGYTNPQDISLGGLKRAVAENSPWLMLIIQAEQSVDTFFFLSGFLLSHLTLKELQRGGGANQLLAILLRYLRLTPSLALTMLVYFGILPYLASGPFALSLQDSIFRRCTGSWWSELTYTMNFIPFDSDKVCMGWTWYLGDDMIFFILGIAIIPIFYRTKLVGWFLLLALSGISLGITAGLIAKYHLSPYVFDQHYAEYSYYAYSKPYTRAPAYFVGVAAAWLLQTLEEKGITRESQTFGRKQAIGATSLALLAFGALCFIVFIPSTDFGTHQNSWNDLDSVLLLDFGRLLWALAWAVITLLCYYGHLPRINSFLSHRFWTPFVRLTYGAYLMHPLVIKLAAGTSVQFYTFSGMDICYRFIGNCSIAYASAVGLWCFIERPLMTLTTAGLNMLMSFRCPSCQKLGFEATRAASPPLHFLQTASCEQVKEFLRR